ncbi:MAG: single-stranded DNA-binding protein [Clostridiales bacterium]|nr:single-stranded DNA-binding protein [Clostridiales bacterium]
MDTNLWLYKAKKTINDMPVHKEFFVKELYEGVEWNELSKGDRLNFGKFFKNAVMDGKIHGIIYIGKAANNSALYRKEY